MKLKVRIVIVRQLNPHNVTREVNKAQVVKAKAHKRTTRKTNKGKESLVSVRPSVITNVCQIRKIKKHLVSIKSSTYFCKKKNQTKTAVHVICGAEGF